MTYDEYHVQNENWLWSGKKEFSLQASWSKITSSPRTNTHSSQTEVTQKQCHIEFRKGMVIIKHNLETYILKSKKNMHLENSQNRGGNADIGQKAAMMILKNYKNQGVYVHRGGQ